MHKASFLMMWLKLSVIFRRRQQRKARKKGNTPWAPGKDDLDRVQNQYTPQPTTKDNHQPDGLYDNLDKEGNPNESTDPALDHMGYLKSLSKQQKEAGSELYDETMSEKDMKKKQKKKKGHKKKKGKKEKIYENDKQPVYENKDVHVNEAFEQPKYLDLTNSLDNRNDEKQVKVTGITNTGFVEDDEYVDTDKNSTTSVKPKTSASTHDKNSDHIKKDKAPVYKNDMVKAETDKSVKTKAETEKVAVNNDEMDEEYEVPDATNYPAPKKSPARTYVNGTQNHKSERPKDKDNSKTKEVNGKTDGKAAKVETGKQRESKYENVKDSAKYVNVANSETVEPVTEEYYEVPDNK